jgi:hypothetical protein
MPSNVLVLVVPLRFVVRIAVATHGAAYFRFSDGGQAKSENRRAAGCDFRAHLPPFELEARVFRGLTLLGPGP